MIAMVRGRGSGGPGSEAVVAASRCDSAVVSVRQMPGHLAEMLSNSARPSRSTRLSRMAETVAVRVPPVRKAISPIGCSGPISVSGIAPALEGHGEAAGDDDVEGVGRVALADEDVAALQGARLELGHERSALVSAELGKDSDGGKAGLGKKRMHR